MPYYGDVEPWREKSLNEVNLLRREEPERDENKKINLPLFVIEVPFVVKALWVSEPSLFYWAPPTSWSFPHCAATILALKTSHWPLNAQRECSHFIGRAAHWTFKVLCCPRSTVCSSSGLTLCLHLCASASEVPLERSGEERRVKRILTPKNATKNQ